jgi:hypothetical protein
MRNGDSQANHLLAAMGQNGIQTSITRMLCPSLKLDLLGTQGELPAHIAA